MKPEMPVLSGGEKRLVIKHTQGKFAGLHRIMGTTSQIPAETIGVPFLPEIDFIDHKGPAGLTRVTSRFMIYSEFAGGPVMGKLGEFHPEQR